jgi:hypothetical protein
MIFTVWNDASLHLVTPSMLNLVPSTFDIDALAVLNVAGNAATAPKIESNVVTLMVKTN